MKFRAFKPAGRPADEANDCTVRALVAVSHASYAEAHALVKSWGRVDGLPFNVTHLLGRTLAANFPKLRKFTKLRVFYALLPHVICGQRGFSARALTLAEFIAKHPRGVYYVCTRDHAFAIRNGTLVDLRSGLVSADSEIDSAWRVS